MNTPVPLPPRPGDTMPVPRPTSDVEALILVVERMARDPASDLARLPPLLDMIERLQAQRSKIRFFEDFAKLQADLPAVVMTGEVIIPGRKTQKYPKLEDVIGAFKKPGGVNGFSITGRQSYPAPEVVAVTTTLAHEAGHFIETTVQAAYDKSGGKNAIQSLGSAISYARRYGQMTLLNIAVAGEDDDGQSVGGTISEEQATEITTLLKETATDYETFCNNMKISGVNEIPAEKYQFTRGALLERKRTQNAATKRRVADGEAGQGDSQPHG